MVYFCSLYIINKIILYLSTYFLHDSLAFENVAEARRLLFPFLCKQSIKWQRSALLLFRGRNILALTTEREKRNESPQSLLNPPSLILLWHSIKAACNFPLLIQSKHKPSFFCMLILMSFVWHKIWMNILLSYWSVFTWEVVHHSFLWTYTPISALPLGLHSEMLYEEPSKWARSDT